LRVSQTCFGMVRLMPTSSGIGFFAASRATIALSSPSPLRVNRIPRSACAISITLSSAAFRKDSRFSLDAALTIVRSRIFTLRSSIGSWKFAGSGSLNAGLAGSPA